MKNLVKLNRHVLPIFLFLILLSFSCFALDLGINNPDFPKLTAPTVTTTSGNITYNNTNITNNYITYNGTGNITGSGSTGEMCVWYNQTQINYSSDFYWASEIDTLFTNYYTSAQIDNLTIVRSYNTSWINQSGLILNWSNVNDTQAKLNYLCATDGKILKRIGGEWQCADDQSGGTGGDGSLNYTKTVEGLDVYLSFVV